MGGVLHRFHVKKKMAPMTLLSSGGAADREISSRGLAALQPIQGHMQKTEITDFGMEAKADVYCCWILVVDDIITQKFCSCLDFL